METQFRHAYLIMAHNNFFQLQTLLSLLDDDRNDIYLHIDRKSADFSPDMVSTRHSRLILVDRMGVYWGGHSQIQCELLLLKAALPGNYRYYHLLSGVDLPLKTQEEIHSFFRANDGTEFLEFHKDANEDKGLFDFRCCYYHPLQNLAGSSRKLIHRILRKADWGIMNLQKWMNWKRPEIVPLYKGANWFSITHGLAQYVVSREKLIRKQFFYSWCADEVFLQSIAMASPYRNRVVNNYLRAIDWQRGDPYTYRAEDVPALLASPNFWGRKFNENLDKEAIDLVVQHLTQ